MSSQTERAYDHREKQILKKFFTNTDEQVFALKNLPDPIKGALLARYSRTGLPLREVFLREFANEIPHQTIDDYDHERTKKFYEKVLDDYGDDSVAQLGSVHIACERVSNIATKAIERGRMASYIEQSTRYQDYSRADYTVPQEIKGKDIETFNRLVIQCFDIYEKLIDPKIKETLDASRGMLPACVRSNVGVYANGQALERLIMRLMASGLEENRDIGERIYKEANKVVPEYLRRIKKQDRGQKWIKYLSKSRQHKATRNNVSNYLVNKNKTDLTRFMHGTYASVYLLDFDKRDFIKIAGSISDEAGVMSYSEFMDKQKDSINEDLTIYECSEIIKEYKEGRENRRHLPGRALEFSDYDFLIVGDYATFRDLQRHRIGTIDWGLLKMDIGLNNSIEQRIISMKDTELHMKYVKLLREIREFYDVLENKHGPEVAQYIVPMMFNIEYRIKVNARQLIYMAELRMRESGHPAYQEILAMMVGILDHASRRNVLEVTNLLINAHLTLPTSRETLIL